jgi:signal transduction histidine kinase/ligand-binding sensor domain-containing protein/DNA-binding response OmpR family regulator
MNRHLFIISVFIFLFLPVESVQCKKKVDYCIKQISIEDGLSQSSVNSIYRDKKGILWIGTRHGITRLDQHEMSYFYHDNDDEHSLPDSYINFIAGDLLNNVWVSTNKGIARYNTENNNFDRIIKGRAFSFLCLNDDILFGGENSIYFYNNKSRNIEIADLPSNGSGSFSNKSIIVCLYHLKNDLVLVGTKNSGLYLLDYKEKKIEPLPFCKGLTILNICFDHTGNFYLSGYKEGLFYYSVDGKLLKRYTLENSSLTNDVILSIMEKDGQIWMGTDGGGINILDPVTGAISSIQHIPGDLNSLPVNSITVLYNDDENNLWAGSVRGGIIGIKETFIKTYKNVPLGNPAGISDRTVISLFEDDKQILWIGTDGGGINSYDPRTDHFTHYPSSYGDKVVSITDLSATELLVCFYSKGLLIFNKATGLYRPFTIVDKKINLEESHSGFVHYAYRVDSDKIYILSHNPYVYIPGKNLFSTFKIKEKGISAEGLNLAYADDSITYLFNDNLIFKGTQKDDSLHVVLRTDASERITSLCYDKTSGRLWLGSDAGLSYFNKGDKTQYRIETSLFNSVSYIFIDKRKRLWIGAQNMLFSFMPEENRFVIWSESDGFFPSEILNTYQKPSGTGYIYLPGTNGLVRISENIPLNEVSVPQLKLSDIIFNGSSYISNVNRKNNTIRIPWNYRSLSISISLHQKDVFLKTLFRYNVLSKSNNQYIESYNHRLDLASLTPGKYTINASCNTKNGTWSQPVQLITIIVTAPWYKSNWFLIAASCLIVGLILLLQLTIIKKHKTKLKWELKEQQQKANEEKINFLINISHELRTPLTLIYAPLKRLIENDEKEPVSSKTVKPQLNAILKQAWQMKNTINMVLDLDKIRGDRDPLQKLPHKLNKWVKATSEDFRKEMENKCINLDYRFDERIENVWFDEWKCQVVLSNMLMNALKFSNENTKVVITTERQGNFVRVSVSDQGCGLKNVEPEKLFSRFYQGKHNKSGSGLGLSYSKTLIELHCGNIGAYNNEAGGATFFFELPLSDGATPLYENLPVGSEINETLLKETPEFSCSVYSLLVVEDEPDLKEFIKDSLSDRFHHIYTAGDGLEALEIIKSMQPDIVVSDVMMPRMDGFELCRQVKTNLDISHIPVILLTAKCDQKSTETGYKLGADFYIPKPFDIDFLLSIIRNILRIREQIKQKYRQNSVFVSPQETTISNADEIFMIRFNKIITESLANPELNIEYLTRNLAMSRASLYNKIKMLTGMGVNDYINKIRIEKATSLLTNTDKSISEIADETGFLYHRYFSSLFKQYKGVSPRQYREESRNGKAAVE